jgi:hypothetical protein
MPGLQGERSVLPVRITALSSGNNHGERRLMGNIPMFFFAAVYEDPAGAEDDYAPVKAA